MKNTSSIHSESEMKTSTLFPSHSISSKSRTYHNLEYKSQIGDQMGLQNARSKSLIEMIGHQRLLDSMSNFSYGPKTPKHSPLMSEDRFIPNRKDLLTTYNLNTHKQNQQNIDFEDPQSLNASDIFNQQILGSKPILSQDTFLYRNLNILRYQQHQSRPVRNFEKKLSLVCYQPLKKLRKVNKIPCKVLDAPSLQDDFYLNLIDWSNHNHLAVGLGNCIYLWDATNSKVTKLCQFSRDMITSVSWAMKGNIIAIGCNSGIVQIWDVKKEKIIRKLAGHQMRVGSMSWNPTCLATGSRDKSILQRDLRMSGNYCMRMQEHKQEICGLKWSFDGNYLASGGNDNKVVVWSSGGQVLNKFTDHRAAVKALAWSPHQHSLLATGGGTIDRTIKMRNIFTGSILCERDAGSQICNLIFSKSLQEVVSTHGYSHHQINLWSYPNMNKVATLVGHTHRVLYLAASPDGSTIVTGAGDQTLRFWNVFPSIHTEKTQKDRKFIGEMTLR